MQREGTQKLATQTLYSVYGLPGYGARRGEVEAPGWLGSRDSNPDTRHQKPLSYL